MATEPTVCLGTGSHLGARTVLGWPDRFVGALRARLLAVSARAPLDATELDDLRVHGLLHPTTDTPTSLGAALIDLLVREQWQDGDEFAPLLREAVTDLTRASVLDVGCSTGRRLRTLGNPAPSARLGIDNDALAVALGWRLARHEEQSISFHCCSATALPFSDASFDLVVCRNALTYMHQRTALREMARVLKPGGVLFLRVENFRYDLLRLRRAGGVKALLVHVRHLPVGLALAASGLQPEPGGFWGWRAFATKRRLRTALQRNGCRVVRVAEAQGTARFLGGSTQTTLLAKKAQ